VKGNRVDYKPLKSKLCSSTNPIVVAGVFKELGFKKVYVADLDAILGKGDNTEVLRDIVEQTGLHLLVDAGVTEIKKVQSLFQNNVAQVIIGTETLQNLNFVKEAVNIFGNEKIVVSLDLMKNKVLCKSESPMPMDALELALTMQQMGVSQMILLELTRVGSKEGVDTAFLRKFKDNLHVDLLAGGGVRNIKDVLLLKDMNIAGVLVATALHSGQLSVDELKQAKLI
jgi:phosphoribosylformimino-5-aminoimidazole carboxamide ribotide isomerase